MRGIVNFWNVASYIATHQFIIWIVDVKVCEIHSYLKYIQRIILIIRHHVSMCTHYNVHIVASNGHFIFEMSQGKEKGSSEKIFVCISIAKI